MQVRSVSWPTQGDQATFRRRATLLAIGSLLAVTLPLAAAVAANPAMLRPVLPLALGTGMLAALWIHGAARTSARRAELEHSFAGLVVLHQGDAYRVADRPILGSHATRRLAADAALERGGWAIIVRAWDRYWLLAASPARDHDSRSQPVSFRTRAVSDVIPAIRDAS